MKNLPEGHAPTPMDSMHSFTEALKTEAASCGFALTGVTAAAAPGRLKAFQDWLDSGRQGSMQYLETRRDAYADPNSILDGCSSILMLAMPYWNRHSEEQEPKPSVEASQLSALQESKGKVARYARPLRDYHDVIHERLKKLKAWIAERHPGAKVRGVVDTAPLLEREFAEQAGLGWVGKNTLLLNRRLGSYFFLAAILTDLPLTLDAPTDHGYCGTCTRCLTACPTDAFPTPYVLDARRCISYLTIENREGIAPDLREQLGDWLFGCDICQEVCPWNQHAAKQAEFGMDAEMEPQHCGLDVEEILTMTDEQFRQRFRKSAFWRPRRRGLLRNAILLAGNKKMHRCAVHLRSLLEDEDPVICEAAEWAIQQLNGEPA